MMMAACVEAVLDLAAAVVEGVLNRLPGRWFR